MNDQQFQKSLANLKTDIDKLKQSVGQITPESETLKMELLDRMYSALSYIHARIDKHSSEMSERWANHMKNHVPNPKTPTQMHKYLQACGMEEDMDVIKPYIAMAKTRVGTIISASYRKDE